MLSPHSTAVRRRGDRVNRRAFMALAKQWQQTVKYGRGLTTAACLERRGQAERSRD